MMTENQLAALHPDLRAHCGRVPSGDYWIRHPLLTSDGRGVTAARLNEEYVRKKAEFDRNVAWGDWKEALFMLHTPHGLRFLWENRRRFEPDDYWRCMVDLWHGAGAFDGVRDLIRPMLNYRTDYRGAFFMQRFERKRLASFPPLLRVYRGYVGEHGVGWSWTRILHTAHFYAHRPYRIGGDGRPGILTALARKEHIIALLMEDSDSEELIIDPAGLEDVRPFPFGQPAADAAHAEEARAALKLARAAYRGAGFHDAFHWMKVDHNAIELCRRVPGADLLVCRLFSYLHDCVREDGDPDHGHGRRAARFIEETCGALAAGLSPGQRGRLLEAVRRHESWEASREELRRDPTIAVCWDADRLDLTRYLAMVEDEWLCTDAARELKWLI